MTIDRQAFIAATVDWLNRRVAPDGVTVDAETRLFERGIVDSLGILRLIAWTERSIGRRIPDREIRMDRFGSVAAIAENFVGRSAGGFAATDAAKRACARCGGCALRGEAARCPRRAA